MARKFLWALAIISLLSNIATAGMLAYFVGTLDRERYVYAHISSGMVSIDDTHPIRVKVENGLGDAVPVDVSNRHAIHVQVEDAPPVAVQILPAR